MKSVLQIEHQFAYKMEMAPEKCPEESVPHSLGRERERVFTRSNNEKTVCAAVKGLPRNTQLGKA